MFEDGGDIGGDEVLAFAQPDDHAAGVADAGADHLVRLVSREQDDAVRALDLLEGAAGGFGQVEAGSDVALDQLDDDFGVGIGVEFHALGGQFVAQLEEVLDDAVVDDDHALRAAQVGVGVFGVRRAVRGPAGVTDARRPADRRLLHQFGQARELAGVAAHLDLASLQHGQPG